MSIYTIELRDDTDEATIRRILEENDLTPVSVRRYLTPEERRANAERDAIRPQLSPQQRTYAEAVSKRGGDGLSIPDPVAWQREQREDRPLPDRD